MAPGRAGRAGDGRGGSGEVSRDQDLQHGLARLRRAVREALDPAPDLLLAGTAEFPRVEPAGDRHGPWLLSEAVGLHRPGGAHDPRGGARRPADLNDPDAAEAARLVALVELARGGGAAALRLPYGPHPGQGYPFVYYPGGSAAPAAD